MSTGVCAVEQGPAIQRRHCSMAANHSPAAAPARHPAAGAVSRRNRRRSRPGPFFSCLAGGRPPRRHSRSGSPSRRGCRSPACRYRWPPGGCFRQMKAVNSRTQPPLCFQPLRLPRAEQWRLLQALQAPMQLAAAAPGRPRGGSSSAPTPARRRAGNSGCARRASPLQTAPGRRATAAGCISNMRRRAARPWRSTCSCSNGARRWC